MSVRRIDDDDVDPRIQQHLRPDQAGLADAGRGTDPQAAVFVLAGVGAALRLFDVLDGDQADAAIVVVDDQQLLDPVLVQQPLGFDAFDAFLHGDQRFVRRIAGHQLAHRLVRIVGEAHVAVGQDAEERPGVRFDHRNARETVQSHQRQGVGKRRIGADRHRIDDHPGFELLDLAHLGRLAFRRHVLVDDADPAGFGHGDGQRAFGDSVHGGGEHRNAKRDGARQLRARIGFRGDEAGSCRHQQHVVECQRFFDLHATSAPGDWRRIIHSRRHLPRRIPECRSETPPVTPSATPALSWHIRANAKTSQPASVHFLRQTILPSLAAKPGHFASKPNATPRPLRRKRRSASVRAASDPAGLAPPEPEGWPSGLRRTLGKRVHGEP